MATPRTLFFFDYLDPLSYLQELELAAFENAAAGLPAERVPLEMRPPPEPLLDPDGEAWLERWRAALQVSAGTGVRLVPPGIIPWTRKAHELVLHAREEGLGAEAHRAVFDAVFRNGVDVGRVDVLVEIAESLGMDGTDTKAVLDVDRYTSAIADLRHQAQVAGVSEPPALYRAGKALRGFHNRDAVRTFLSFPS